MTIASRHLHQPSTHIGFFTAGANPHSLGMIADCTSMEVQVGFMFMKKDYVVKSAVISSKRRSMHVCMRQEFTLQAQSWAVPWSPRFRCSPVSQNCVSGCRC